MLPAFLIFLSLFVISLWDRVNVFGASIDAEELETGTPLSSPPLIDLISNDPILRRVKVFLIILSFSCKAWFIFIQEQICTKMRSQSHFLVIYMSLKKFMELVNLFFKN